MLHRVRKSSKALKLWSKVKVIGIQRKTMPQYVKLYWYILPTSIIGVFSNSFFMHICKKPYLYIYISVLNPGSQRPLLVQRHLSGKKTSTK